MDGSTSGSARKRSLPGDSCETDGHPVQKRARFPKGKKDARKAKTEDGIDEAPVDSADPRFAAKERAKRRNQFTAELFTDQGSESIQYISAAEEKYQDNEIFEDDGILMEPFNLNQEREEGYFDADGNFVEYARENEIKDAWLDDVEVDSRFAKKASVKKGKEEDIQDLSSQDIAKIKRRIANVLQSGETVLQALRRLKGISNGKKGKMPEETKRVFDQLTEDSMKLLDNGEYNAYHDEREVFDREAEGYERIARARDGASMSSLNGALDSLAKDNIFSTGPGDDVCVSNSNMATAQVSSGVVDDAYDMFGDDEKTALNQSLIEDSVGPQSAAQISLLNSESGTASRELENDYVYDESSGYYYSSTLGYYYDPNSGLYCCATSGRWYSFNEQAGSYEEYPGQAAADAIQGGETR